MDVKGPMKSILEDMGRAAREGRARRYTGDRPASGVKVGVGELTMQPNGVTVDVDEPTLDPVKGDMSDDEMNELAQDLQVQR